MPKLLELFCGTKSVGNVFEKNGYEVTSLDYNAKFNATHTEDILTWDYKQYQSNYFDVIWASPDCTTWSLASGGKYRLKTEIYGRNNQHQDKATLGNNMILRLIEILKYFNCKAWFIENPKALLRHFPRAPPIDTPLIVPSEEINDTIFVYEWNTSAPVEIVDTVNKRVIINTISGGRRRKSRRSKKFKRSKKTRKSRRLKRYRK
jgi:site-specific DNA-cytosine methylase